MILLQFFEFTYLGYSKHDNTGCEHKQNNWPHFGEIIEDDVVENNIEEKRKWLHQKAMVAKKLLKKQMKNRHCFDFNSLLT